MNYDQFNSLSCCEEFEIQCDLLGVSKIDVLKEIGHRINDYYFFVSHDGLFNWYDLTGNHIEDPSVLKEIKETYIPFAITKCIIPNSVISISYEAFCNCKSLKEIIIPNSVTSIGDCAFGWCESLEKISIPNSVTSIGNYVFTNCESLKEITIPDSMISIKYYAFYNCKSLTSITIPDTVTSISYYAFNFCNALKEVIFKGKTLAKVKRIKNYPFGLKDESIIKVSEI